MTEPSSQSSHQAHTGTGVFVGRSNSDVPIIMVTSAGRDDEIVKFKLRGQEGTPDSLAKHLGVLVEKRKIAGRKGCH